MCGYIYDEARGNPNINIVAGTTWEILSIAFE
ncbi:rubredoxin [Oscillibacter valericigenes]|nr:rubredoxin [Oscillibacter ruminantium]MDN0033384.1 rubredoxin [Oscillibacter valericigenes]